MASFSEYIACNDKTGQIRTENDRKHSKIHVTIRMLQLKQNGGNVMKKMERRILLFFTVFVLLLASACTSKESKATPTDKGKIVTKLPDEIKIPDNNRDYKNNMTEAEKSKVQSKASETGEKISFYDSEINSSYVFDLIEGGTYDKSKDAVLYIVLGGSLNSSEQAALSDYLDQNEPQTLVAVLNINDVSVKSMNRDYVTKLQNFQSFITDNLLGWFCENYKIDTKRICITGYGTAGFFTAYTIYKGNPVQNYLLINPEMNKRKDKLDMAGREKKYFSDGNKSLPANVCMVRTEEDEKTPVYTAANNWVKAVTDHSYQGFVLKDLVLKGEGHNTMKMQALLRGISYFNKSEYGKGEEACVTASNAMTIKEKESIKVGKLSHNHEFYQEVVTTDPKSKDYIKEIAMYDEEINDNYVIHLTLPEGYDKTKKYPLVLMTDGVWRLSDHPMLRKMMNDGKIENVILVSVGYPDGYDYFTTRTRDLVDQPDLFLKFLVDNLMPYLYENYSVDTSKVTLTGHSYGGYWASYVLFHSDTIAKDTFSSYYIGSPSVQVNTNIARASDFEQWYFDRKQSLDYKVYVTVGGDEEPGFIGMIESFLDGMNEHTYQGLSMKYEVIKGCNHDTVFKPSIKNMLLECYGKK